ncbi:MAG: TIGR02281 family clan AA aspartic protease [Pseudomonadota bacterium]
MDLASLPQYILAQPLLALALLSMAIAMLGSLLRRASPAISGLFRWVGNLGLFGTLLLTVMQVMRVSQGVDIALPQMGLPAQQVSGRETRVPIARDGHFWIRATVNGVAHRFLVDTGATLTAIAPELAQRAQVEPLPMRQPVLLRTANGSVSAQLVTIGELQFGNVVARDLDAVVAPGMGSTSVLGMNFLSRLASWRVEGNTMILTPHHPQPEPGA